MPQSWFSEMRCGDCEWMWYKEQVGGFENGVRWMESGEKDTGILSLSGLWKDND